MFNSKLAKVSWDDSEFNVPEHLRIHQTIPPLMVGIDTETSGLDPSKENKNNPDPSVVQPISYGLVVYRNGVQHGPTQHFLVNSKVPIQPGAEKTHGWNRGRLQASYEGKYFKDKQGGLYLPALHPKVGINKVAETLAHFQKQGAVFVGANHKNYDIPILKNTFKVFNGGLPIETSGFNPDKAKLVDVIQHDRTLDPQNRSDPRYRPRSLTALSEHYGVDPGGHRALDDARASIDVFIKQVERNKRVYGT